jgi:hypothetical protein
MSAKRPSPSPPKTIESVTAAHRALNEAAIMRADIEEYGFSSLGESLDADALQIAALAYLYPDPPVVGDKGELVPLEAASKPRHSPKVSARADNERLRLASEARADELAIDMAESVGAETSLEKAMAHQLAAAHALALRVIGRANLEIEGMGRFDRQGRREAIVEVARLSNAAARLMQTYQQGALALTKIRGGGAQTIVVQHVQVNDGGQAVIAGQAGGASGKGGEGGN